MILASTALLAGLSSALAQEQEAKFIDRLLKPNLSLVNPAQNKQFDVSRTFAMTQVPSKSFCTAAKPVAKSFPTARTFSTRQFATTHFRAGETAQVPARSQSLKTDSIQVAPVPYATRVAPENERTLPVVPFPGDRPFLAQGKSQKALSAQDRPLTIEQVRELLNKNK